MGASVMATTQLIIWVTYSGKGIFTDVDASVYCAGCAFSARRLARKELGTR